MDDDSEIDFGGIIINIIFIPFFIFLFSALFGNLILYRLYTKFVEYIFYQLGLSEGAGSIFALLWALLPGVLLALFLFGFLMYFLNKIIGDSTILRLLVAIFTFGMLEGFLEIDFFNFGEGSGEHAIATEDTSGIEVGHGEDSTAVAENTTIDSGADQAVQTVSEWSPDQVAEHYSTVALGESPLSPELEYVESYVKDSGVQVDGYVRTVADGVTWNNLG